MSILVHWWIFKKQKIQKKAVNATIKKKMTELKLGSQRKLGLIYYLGKQFAALVHV